MANSGFGELLRLRADFVTLKLYCNNPRTFMFALVDAGLFAQVSYRLLRAWRLSPLHIALLRGLAERLVELFTKIHLPTGLQAGPGLLLIHGHGTVINAHAVLGSNVTIYHRVTIGVRFLNDESPKIGNGVTIGSGAGVFGPIFIPDGTTIPANAVVTPKTGIRKS